MKIRFHIDELRIDASLLQGGSKSDLADSIARSLERQLAAAPLETAGARLATLHAEMPPEDAAAQSDLGDRIGAALAGVVAG